ncbi:sodium:proton antiporter NhaD [Tamlana sp. s12]|uniref:sodium:proton antiporter NhaD n=1 Tax=Tamlana sp. s12 TaxID=1630406 RepID=UPI0008024B03|nr:sodium:proton antiporter NhaD [Tamlana sp. s12]OBQ56128.1 sodium:proton antiporter [Tamlana sp. s12]QQY83358.1 sodium:proton antiporter NhaD [Tamlana sp. s12]
MEAAIILVFVLGYLAITMEHSIKIDKLIPALIMMAICWALVALGLDMFPNWFDSSTHTLIDTFGGFPLEEKKHLMEETLLHHLGKTAEILVFLLGAMTIVEIIDYFDGFSTIKGFITTKKKTKILWIFSILAFILSAIIDNLTATIVLISILQKIVKEKEVRLYYAGLIIIAANAGGAWSPIGDVTTTMLWIGNKVTTGHLVGYLFVPSLMCMAVPTFIASFLPVFKGELQTEEGVNPKPSRLSSIMLYLGLGAIVFVPIFKTVTHLPPYVGMMLSLAVVAIFAEIYSKSKFSITDIDNAESEAHAHHSPVHHSLSKIELPSILFFLGILMAVAALESLGILFGFAGGLQEMMPMIGTEIHSGEGVSDLVVLLLGVGSAVIDNVPLVAASLGMFHEATDNELWHFIAFSAGTGGSMLIIGSAAGVVAMGMEKIDFFWYLKKISWLALIGFLVGSAVFMVTRTLF